MHRPCDRSATVGDRVPTNLADRLAHVGVRTCHRSVAISAPESAGLVESVVVTRQPVVALIPRHQSFRFDVSESFSQLASGMKLGTEIVFICSHLSTEKTLQSDR